VLIKIDEFFSFLRRCKSEGIGNIRNIILPVESFPAGNRTEFQFTKLNDHSSYRLDGFRTIDPLKILYYHAREKVFPIDDRTERRLIVGVKACDLKAFHILEEALINKDFIDPAFQAWRDSTIIISSDCTAITPTCHCNLVGGKPFPETGFDLNLSPVNDLFFIVAGSEKGHEFFQIIKSVCNTQTADPSFLSTIDQKRLKVIEQLEIQNNPFIRPDDYHGLRAADIAPWKEKSHDCIGCGACTNICPTCYCLILNEESQAHQFVKVRSYDSCQWNGYARVAGGGTPRPHMHERFRNRYLCKFDYMKKNFNVLGCTGCGRCTEACPAHIDFREVVHDILHPNENPKHLNSATLEA